MRTTKLLNRLRKSKEKLSKQCNRCVHCAMTTMNSFFFLFFLNECCYRVQVKIMCVWSPVVIFQSMKCKREENKRMKQTEKRNENE